MAISVVAGQSVTSGATNTTTAAHFNNTTGVGSAIVVAIVTNNVAAGAASVTDNASNAYTKQGSSYQANGMTVELWACLSAASTGSPTQTVTATAVNSSDFIVLAGQEITGLATSGAYDSQRPISSASATSLTTPSLTNVLANEILIAVGAQIGATRPFTQGAGYSMITTNTGSSSAGIAMEYQIISSIGANTASMTIDLASTFGLVLFALKVPTPPRTGLPGNAGRYLTVGNGMSRSEMAN